MKPKKEGNTLRLIAILLVAATLVFTVGFATGGWQSGNSSTQNGQNSGNADNSSGDSDQNTKPPVTETPTIPEPKIPDYLSPVTGLEITEKEYTSGYFTYLLDSSSALHGISEADFLIEFPTENGNTRIAAYLNSAKSSSPKIGAISPTRDYISAIVTRFGGLLISNGNDDIIEYCKESFDEKTIDLSKNVGYFYSENEKKIYTNKNLMEALSLTHGISPDVSKIHNSCFNFNEYFADDVASDRMALGIDIPFSTTQSTKFTFSQNGEYTLSKNGSGIIDTKNENMLSYKNVFVLFADATTHEKSDGTETVLDTTGSGIGYYFTNGTQFKIRWYSDDNGALVLLNETGEKLVVNRGKSYLLFAKYSSISEMKIS